MGALSESQLQSFALRMFEMAVVGGFVGAIIWQTILGCANAAAEYLARKMASAARIRAARNRATSAPSVAESVRECMGIHSCHVWDGDVCVTCGVHAPVYPLRREVLNE